MSGFFPSWSWLLYFEKKEKIREPTSSFKVLLELLYTIVNCEVNDLTVSMMLFNKVSDLAASGNILSFDVIKSSAHGQSEAIDDRYHKISKGGNLVMLFLNF